MQYSGELCQLPLHNTVGSFASCLYTIQWGALPAVLLSYILPLLVSEMNAADLSAVLMATLAFVMAPDVWSMSRHTKSTCFCCCCTRDPPTSMMRSWSLWECCGVCVCACVCVGVCGCVWVRACMCVCVWVGVGVGVCV